MKKSDFSNPPQHHLILVKASKFQGIFIALFFACKTLTLWNDFEISRHFCQGRGKLIQVHHVAVWLNVKFQCGAKKVLSYYCQTEFLIIITHLKKKKSAHFSFIFSSE